MEKNEKKADKVGSAIVIGGGIGGMQAAIDLAEAGIKVYLVEKSPAIGGRMVQLDKTFPTNECAMCVVSPKLVECERNLNIEIITNSEIEKLTGEPGNFTVTLRKKPRYIKDDVCTACNACILNCPVQNKINIIEPEKIGKIKLTAKVEAVVKKIIREQKGEKGALMLILQKINSVYNYFSEEVLKYVSQELDIPLSVILRIVTFYDAFSLVPRGKHMISVCMGTTCYVKGSQKILNKVSETLNIAVGGTTEDLLFSLKSVRCLGCCSIAPALMIEDKAYGHVKIAEIQKILKEYK